MKTPKHLKNQKPGNTKTIDMDSSNCYENVTISVLVSQSYPVKNQPKYLVQVYQSVHTWLITRVGTCMHFVM